MPESVKAITTKQPTYLEALLQEACNIKLVYREKLKLVEQPQNDDSVQVCEELSELELTGTPLHTDLGGDDTVGTEVILERPPNWTSEEAHQYPLTLNNARTFINTELRSNKSSKSIYCICDGTDPQHTVGLGTIVVPGRITRILVYVLPCYSENHEITTTEFLKKEHIKSVRQYAEIKMSTTKKYNLFGYNLRNCDALQNAEYNGHIEVSTEEYNEISKSNSNIKMNLQVVVAHSNSPLQNFWEELCLIQSYIKQLESSKLNESTILNSGNTLDCVEINSIINDFVNTVTSKKKITYETLDLKNLRQFSVLDKLWNVLKHCSTLSDLRDCFTFFFEELAEKQTNIQLQSEDKSAVGEIVNGILDGRVAVPTLSFFQSVELLIELGLEKLKSDYLVIIANFYGIAKELLMKKWNELNTDKCVVNSKKSTQRRTRTSINPKAPITDLISSKLKLSYLDSLHKLTEFIFVFKENLPMLEECFYYFCDALCNQFIANFPNVVQSCDLKQPRLCQFSFNISSADANVFIKDKSPGDFTVKLSSALPFSEVHSVFHFSEYPIFPPSVFADYDIKHEESELRNLYVTKLVKYVQLC